MPVHVDTFLPLQKRASAEGTGPLPGTWLGLNPTLLQHAAKIPAQVGVSHGESALHCVTGIVPRNRFFLWCSDLRGLQITKVKGGGALKMSGNAPGSSR